MSIHCSNCAFENATDSKFCENCGRPMVPKRGRFGMFLACTGYPECKTTRPLNDEKPMEIPEEAKVCPKCNYHFRISASERLPYLVDEGTFLEVEDGLSPKDFLGFKDYKEKLKSSRKKTGLKDAIISGEAKIGGQPVQASMDADGRIWVASLGNGGSPNNSGGVRI